MSVVLIVGAASSGKSSLAKAWLETGVVAQVIASDSLRYVSGAGWTKRPLLEYVRALEEAVREGMATYPGLLIALDTIVFDASDPEDARGVAVRHLCDCGLVCIIVYLSMEAPRLMLGLLTRTMRRAKGAEAQHPAAQETPESVMHLLKKHATYTDTILPKIQAFVSEAKTKGISIIDIPAVPLPVPWDSIDASHLTTYAAHAASLFLLL